MTLQYFGGIHCRRQCTILPAADVTDLIPSESMVVINMGDEFLSPSSLAIFSATVVNSAKDGLNDVFGMIFDRLLLRIFL